MMSDHVRNPAEIIDLMRKLMLDEGCVVISPHQDQFLRVERSFLDGIRNVPATVSAPPGVNPYGAALGHRGRWMFVWIPE
jgi:hypothetical protein